MKTLSISIIVDGRFNPHRAYGGAYINASSPCTHDLAKASCQIVKDFKIALDHNVAIFPNACSSETCMTALM